MAKREGAHVIPYERIQHAIYVLRGHQVLFDQDLAAMYGVETRALNQAVSRNAERFPEDFAFQLTEEEYRRLKSQTVTSSWGGRRKRPWAFTEQGVAMLSSVLRSPRAVRVNVEIMRAFVRLRNFLSTHEELSQQIDELESRVGDHDEKIEVIFEAIRKLMKPPPDDEADREWIGYADRR